MFVELMMAFERRMNIVMLELYGRSAGILSQNQVHLFQHAERTKSDVLKIANGCRYDVEHFSFPFSVFSLSEASLEYVLKVLYGGRFFIPFKVFFDVRHCLVE